MCASPLVNPALSQSSLQEHSPQSVMRKPWGDKFNFLASLSEDGKYQDLLQEINQAFLSDVSLFASSLRYSAKLYFGSVLVSTLSRTPTTPLGLVGHGLEHGFQRHSTLAATSRFGGGCRAAHISLTHWRRERVETSRLMRLHSALDASFVIWRQCSSLMNFIPPSTSLTARSTLTLLRQSSIRHLTTF